MQNFLVAKNFKMSECIFQPGVIDFGSVLTVPTVSPFCNPGYVVNATEHVCRKYKWGCHIYFCGSFMFLCCLVFAMSLCASVYMCFVVTCWERADLLALVCCVL